MTIENVESGFIVNCDKCPNYFEKEIDKFKEFIKYMKIEGWKTRQENDEWINLCPVCQEEGK